MPAGSGGDPPEPRRVLPPRVPFAVPAAPSTPTPLRQGPNEPEDQHSGADPPPVRGGVEDSAGGQGARPALPAHLYGVRDEAAGARRRRTHRLGGPPHRARPGPGDARRAAARHLRPHRTGELLFAFFAAIAETERENIRESTLERLDTAARKGKHGGQPPVITDDMLHTVLRRRAGGESVEQIQPDLIIPMGKRKGQNPSVPAFTGRSPNTPSARHTPRPSSRPRRLRRPPGRRSPRTPLALPDRASL
ncbi:recombinase family protein [Streptomyces sp. NPDC055254]